jgi:hypothetical protein
LPLRGLNASIMFDYYFDTLAPKACMLQEGTTA